MVRGEWTVFLVFSINVLLRKDIHRHAFR